MSYIFRPLSPEEKKKNSDYLRTEIVAWCLSEEDTEGKAPDYVDNIMPSTLTEKRRSGVIEQEGVHFDVYREAIQVVGGHDAIFDMNALMSLRDLDLDGRDTQPVVLFNARHRSKGHKSENETDRHNANVVVFYFDSLALAAAVHVDGAKFWGDWRLTIEFFNPESQQGLDGYVGDIVLGQKLHSKTADAISDTANAISSYFTAAAEYNTDPAATMRAFLNTVGDHHLLLASAAFGQSLPTKTAVLTELEKHQEDGKALSLRWDASGDEVVLLLNIAGSDALTMTLRAGQPLAIQGPGIEKDSQTDMSFLTPLVTVATEYALALKNLSGELTGEHHIEPTLNNAPKIPVRKL